MADYKNKTRAFIDVETTGTDPTVHEIIEYAIILEWPDGTYAEFTNKVLPQHIDKADPKALKINGYTEEAWQDALTPVEAAWDIARHLKGTAVIGHNVHFDLDFLMALMKKEKLSPHFGVPAVDTMTLAWEHLGSAGLQSLSLKSVCKFLGIEPEPEKHEALAEQVPGSISSPDSGSILA